MSSQAAHPIDQQIQASLQKASTFRNRLKTSSVRYTIAGLVLSTLATFFAGLSSLSGKPIVVNDWRITCAIAAVFTLGATIAAGVQSQLAKPDLLTQASECVGKLRALAIDTLEPGFDAAQVRQQYRAVLTEYAQVDV